MQPSIKQLAENKDHAGLKKALLENPALANEGIPYDEKNTTKAHPLHRLCDAVFTKKITDDEAVEIAKILLQHGAKINGNELKEKQDSPLVAAASLYSDKVAMLYIDNDAEINHGGCHGGTALHWAAWCGRNKVVEKLIEAKAPINKLCIDFKSTPLFWAVHGLKNGGGKEDSNYAECVRLLLAAGADKNIPNADGKKPVDLLSDKDWELKFLLN